MVKTYKAGVNTLQGAFGTKIPVDSQGLVKNTQRPQKPDFTLGLLRLVILTAAAGMLIGFGPVGVILTSDPVSQPLDVAEIAGCITSGFIFLYVLVFVFCIRKANEWERVVVLRWGKFHKVRGPGLFFLAPLADRAAQTVDIRIRVTDFSAQETLTRDSVTVTVDAICFWLVWDPQKAVLEVADYEDAVILSSKTALRNAVSGNDLSTFLERGDLIEKQIQTDVDKKTTEWGVTVQFVEITDIQLPEELQDSLSRVAQAEREKKARTLLAEAEIEIAKKLQEAVQVYANNEPAMKLKILSILNEGLKAGNSMMLVPNSIAEELKTKDIFGLEALNELRKKE